MKYLSHSIAAALVALPVLNASALEVLTNEHVDIGLGMPTELGISTSMMKTTMTIRAWRSLLYVGEAARSNRPANSKFDFIGRWPWRTVLGSSADPGSGTPLYRHRDGNRRKCVCLLFQHRPAGKQNRSLCEAVTGSGARAGDLSIWSFDSNADPLVWWATSDGITNNDSLYVLEGSHNHYNYGFTVPGVYEVDVRASAFLGPGGTNLTTSEIITYQFGSRRCLSLGRRSSCLGTVALGARRRRRAISGV
jgi:surface-anchored protein